MPGNTRVIAQALVLTAFIAVAASITFGLIGRDPGAQQSSVRPDAGFTTLRAAIRTQWLSPADARRSLDARSLALAQWLQARGGTLRTMSSSASLRTRAADGGRLAQPEARFERLIEIQVPHAVDLAQARLALLGPDGTIGVAGETRRARHGAHSNAAPMSNDF